MSKLTADDIVDLGRWHFIQFKDEATAHGAMERYRRFVQRQRLLTEGITDGPSNVTDADQRDDGVDDPERRAA